MVKSETFIKRWIATLITIPLTIIFFLTGLLSTGLGHGTPLLLQLYYPPMYLLQKLAPNLLPEQVEGILGISLICGLHLCYAGVVDKIKYRRLGVIPYVILLSLHYGLFYLVVRHSFDQELFAKSFAIFPKTIIFGISTFIFWQAGLLILIIFQRQYLISRNGV